MKYGKIYLILLKVTRALTYTYTIKIVVQETLSDLLNHVFPLVIHFCNMEIVNDNNNANNSQPRELSK